MMYLYKYAWLEVTLLSVFGYLPYLLAEVATGHNYIGHNYMGR